jgi:PAS domain S-box-containing protein
MTRLTPRAGAQGAPRRSAWRFSTPTAEYIRVHDALCAMLGRSAEELLGRRDQELTHPDDRAADVAVAWEILDGKRSTHQVEKRFVHADGSAVWVIASLTFLRDDTGRGRPVRGHHRAPRDRAGAARQRGALPLPVRPRADRDRAARARRVLAARQPPAAQDDRLREEELLTAAFQDITHPDDLELDLEQVQAMLAGRIRTYEMEKRYFRADGSVLWVLLSVSLVRDDAGEPLYFVSQLQDIDERMRTHSELQRLARRDPLTGTLNRRAWDEDLGTAVGRSGKTGEAFGIVLMDVNSFKPMTTSATRPATSCSSRPSSPGSGNSAARTCSHGSAATSSPCWCRAAPCPCSSRSPSGCDAGSTTCQAARSARRRGRPTTPPTT